MADPPTTHEETATPDVTAPTKRRLPVARVVLLALLLLAALAVRLQPISRSIAFLDGRTLIDDSYYSLEIAKNVGQGKGPLYGDTLTNGFQPLYVYLAAPFYSGASAEQLKETAFLDAAIERALWVIIVFDLASILLLALLLARRCGWGIAPFAGAALWAAHPLFVKTSLNGLETSIAAFFFLAVWSLSDRRQHATRFTPGFVLGLLLGLGMLARIDMAIAAFWIFVLLLWNAWRQKSNASVVLHRILSIGLGWSTGYLPWLLYSWKQTGLWFPVSGEAVRYQSLCRAHHEPTWIYYRDMLVFARNAIVDSMGYLWIAALIVSIAILVISRFTKRRTLGGAWIHDCAFLLLPILFSVSLFLAYVFYIQGYWFFARYFFPMAIIPVMLIACGLHHLMGGRRTTPLWSSSLAVLIIVGLCALHPAHRELQTGEVRLDQGYRMVGTWAAGYFPPGTVVGSFQTGGLGYYAPELHIVNLDGVVNAEALESQKAQRLMQYIRERQVQYVIGWRNKYQTILDHSQPGAHRYLRNIGQIHGIRSLGGTWFVFEVL